MGTILVSLVFLPIGLKSLERDPRVVAARFGTFTGSRYRSSIDLWFLIYARIAFSVSLMTNPTLKNGIAIPSNARMIIAAMAGIKSLIPEIKGGE